MSDCLFWIVLVPLACALGWPRSLVVEGPVPSSGTPAIGTLAFAPDELTVERARRLEVTGARGRRPAMALPLVLHANGSVRLARVLASVQRGETSLQLERVADSRTGVDSGPFELPHARIASLGDAGLPLFRARDGTPLLQNAGAPFIELIDRDLAPRLFGARSSRCVFRTAAAARFHDRMSVDCGSGELFLESFSTLFAGCDAVDLCLLFVAAGELRSQGVRFELGLEPPIGVRIQGRAVADDRAGRGDWITIAADAQGEVTLQIGQRTAEAFEARDLAVDLRGRAASVRLVIPEFARLGPRRVEITPTGRLVFDLLAAPRRWSDGEALRADLSLSVVPRASAADEPMSPVSAERPRLRDRSAGLEREPLFASRLSRSAKTGERELTEAASTVLEDEANRSVGVFDHGDFRLANGQFSNHEFDPLLGLTLDYVRHGRAASLALASDLVRHWSAQDIIRGSFDPELAGMPWQHGDDHASRRFELGHVFFAGPLRAHLLLDDPLLDEVVGGLLERLPAVCDDDRLFHNERSLGWGLAALADVVLVTDDPAAKARISQVLERLESRQAAEGYFHLDAVTREAERCWQVNLWVTALTTFEALAQVCDLTHDERALNLLRRLIAFFDREVTTYPSFSAPNRVFFRTRDGMRQGSSGHLRGADLALVAALFDRASQWSSDPGLARKAAALWARVRLEDLGPARGPELAKLLRALAFRRG
jgi:hypothetical protein